MTLPTVTYNVRVRCGTPLAAWASGIQVPHDTTVITERSATTFRYYTRLTSKMTRVAAMTERRRASAAVAVLRAVHRQPGIERAAAARKLMMTSGLITETVTRLSGLDLLSEHPAPRTGARGRPTTTLDSHPRGPLVVAVAIGHETWQIAVAQLGGTELARA